MKKEDQIRSGANSQLHPQVYKVLSSSLDFMRKHLWPQQEDARVGPDETGAASGSRPGTGSCVGFYAIVYRNTTVIRPSYPYPVLHQVSPEK